MLVFGITVEKMTAHLMQNAIEVGVATWGLRKINKQGIPQSFERMDQVNTHEIQTKTLYLHSQEICNYSPAVPSSRVEYYRIECQEGTGLGVNRERMVVVDGHHP
jgi:hypothetical protein